MAQAFLAETGQKDLAAMAAKIRRLFPDAVAEYAHLGRTIHKVLLENQAAETRPMPERQNRPERTVPVRQWPKGTRCVVEQEEGRSRSNRGCSRVTLGQPLNEMTPNIKNSIGCANCHEAGTMRLIVTNPALEEALKAQGKDWTTFTRQEMRTVVCANCHVEYYFKGDGKYLTFPWAKGTNIDQIISYYEESGFKDWEYPDTGTPMLKAQHPEYEFFTADSTHFKAGVACADCHMPYVSDGAAKYSSHDVHSPLLNPEAACGQCHTDTRIRDPPREPDPGPGLRRPSRPRKTPSSTRSTPSKLRAANPKADAALLDQARNLHRKAQFMWDFVSAENSTGFHNPEYALKILANPPTWRARRKCWPHSPWAICRCWRLAHIMSHLRQRLRGNE